MLILFYHYLYLQTNTAAMERTLLIECFTIVKHFGLRQLKSKKYKLQRGSIINVKVIYN